MSARALRPAGARRGRAVPYFVSGLGCIDSAVEWCVPQSRVLGDEDHAREFEMLCACYLFVGGVPDRGKDFAFGFIGGCL